MVAHHERLKPGALAARSSLSVRAAGCEMSMHGVAVLVSIRATEAAGSLPHPWSELFARAARKIIEVRCQLRHAKLGEDPAAFLQDRDFSITVVSFGGLSLADTECEASGGQGCLCRAGAAALVWQDGLKLPEEIRHGYVVSLEEAGRIIQGGFLEAAGRALLFGGVAQTVIRSAGG